MRRLVDKLLLIEAQSRFWQTVVTLVPLIIAGLCAIFVAWKVGHTAGQVEGLKQCLAVIEPYTKK